MDMFNRGDGGREYTMRPNISGFAILLFGRGGHHCAVVAVAGCASDAH
jgi:hypothetical protein